MVIDPEIIRSENYPNAKALTRAQKTALRTNHPHNLICSGVEYDSDERLIVITTLGAFKSWLYYIGFEYINEDEYVVLKDQGNLIAIFFGNETDRVNEICNVIDDVNPCEEDNEATDKI